MTLKGQKVGRYDKIHLVPFGEYIPFARLLFFAHKLTGRVASYTPGTEAQSLSARYAERRASSLRFLHLLRGSVCRRGARARAHWRRSAGEYQRRRMVWRHQRAVAALQHGSHAGRRKNRRWLLRDTNNGVTAAIDPYGRVRQSIPSPPGWTRCLRSLLFAMASPSTPRTEMCSGWLLCHAEPRNCCLGWRRSLR